MTRQNITEILAAHADQLNRGEKDAKKLPAPFDADRTEVEPLLAMATRLKRTLEPTSVPAQYRAHLRHELVMAAQHRASQKILIERRDSAWGWLLGAAALGSAAGLIAIAIRAKHTRQPIAQVVAETVQTN